MAKAIGLIGNFKGKVGNMVGYKLSDSNTGNSQGIRIYQPIVKNPKTSAQAEQRAKLAPINATYRALKMVIDRGNEGLPYGNKSRLAWLKQAFKASEMPWFVKGSTVDYPVACQLTKGSLITLDCYSDADGIRITAGGVTSESNVATIGAISTLLLAAYPSMKDGDQVTLVSINMGVGVLTGKVFSFIVDSTSTDAVNFVTADKDALIFTNLYGDAAVSAILSREGANGEHLRSNAKLILPVGATAAAPYNATSKAAAIESYKNSASGNADWAEESIQ